MEWVGLITWFIILMLALPVAGGGLASMALAVQSLFVMGGLGACVLYIALDGGRWLAWTSFGMAVAAGITLAFGAQRLLAEDQPGGKGPEMAAGPAGVESMLLPAAAFAMLLAATGVTTIS